MIGIHVRLALPTLSSPRTTDHVHDIVSDDASVPLMSTGWLCMETASLVYYRGGGSNVHYFLSRLYACTTQREMELLHTWRNRLCNLE